jgi:hypothetical protein
MEGEMRGKPRAGWSGVASKIHLEFFNQVETLAANIALEQQA